MAGATLRSKLKIAMHGPDAADCPAAVNLATQIGGWMQMMNSLPPSDRDYKIFQDEKTKGAKLTKQFFNGQKPGSPAALKAYVELESIEIARSLLMHSASSWEGKSDQFFRLLGKHLAERTGDRTPANLHSYCIVLCYGIEAFKRTPKQQVIPTLNDLAEAIGLDLDEWPEEAQLARVLKDIGATFKARKRGRKIEPL